MAAAHSLHLQDSHIPATNKTRITPMQTTQQFTLLLYHLRTALTLLVISRIYLYKLQFQLV